MEGMKVSQYFPTEEHGMKKVLASVLVVVTVLMGTMAHGVEQGKKSDIYKYGVWSSYFLQSPNITSARMMAFSSATYSALIVDFYPNGNISICIEIIPNKMKDLDIKKSFDNPIYGKVLVSKGKMHDVIFNYNGSTNVTMLISLDSPFCVTLIQEAYNADPSGVIRIKMEGIPNLLEYPLKGFVEAMDRCKALLQFL